MAETTIKIFLASSEELESEREAFNGFIYRKCIEWKKYGFFFEVVMWEDFLDVMSKSRLQDEYNKAIRECDLFVMLFWTKVGKYTKEEFETAFKTFQETNKPFIITYFKEDEANNAIDPSVVEFKNKLKELGHFCTVYKNLEWLFVHFNSQLEKLYKAGFDKFERKDEAIQNEADKVYRPINALLTKQLTNSIEPYSAYVQKFLASARRTPDWETQERICKTAQIVICCSYVGVLGIQLSKLFAIGQSDYSEARQLSYINNCSRALQRVLQLICFSYLSRLWDYKKNNSLQLEEGLSIPIQQFFEDQFEQGIEQYLSLFQSLFDIFEQASLDHPIPELQNILRAADSKKKLLDACQELDRIARTADRRDREVFSASRAEEQLSEILSMLAFLARYKMVSIKSVAYDAMRYAPPRYIHHFVSIGINSKQQQNEQGLDYVEFPVNTDVILLYTDQYQNSIDLFPFIIDANALVIEGGSRICFYSHQDTFDNTLHYSFLEGDASFNVAFEDIAAHKENISELLIDSNKWKQLKLDKAFALFQEAKDTILS